MSQETIHLNGIDRRFTEEGALDTLTRPAAYKVSVALGTVSAAGLPQYQECTLLLSKGTTILRKKGPTRLVFLHSSLDETRTVEDNSENISNTTENGEDWPYSSYGWYGTSGFVIDDTKADQKASWYMNIVPRGAGASSYDLGPRMEFTGTLKAQQEADADEEGARGGLMTEEQATSTGNLGTPGAIRPLDTLIAPAAFDVSVAIDTSSQPAQYQKCTLLLSPGTTILRNDMKYCYVWYHSSHETKELEDDSEYGNTRTAEGERLWPHVDRGWYGTKGFVIDDSKADRPALWLENIVPKSPGATSYDLGPRLDVTQAHTDAAERTDRSGVMTKEQGMSTGVAFA